MSVMCSVLGVTPAQIRALRAKPALVSKLAHVARIDQFKAHADDPNPSVADARAALAPLGPIEKSICLEKSWHMLHYLFTGHVGTWRPGELHVNVGEPGEVGERGEEVYGPSRLYDEMHAPGNLLLTGEELGENVGYGPARLHDAQETSEFSRFLEGRDIARLRAHTDFAEMNRAGVMYGAEDPGDYALHQMLHEEIAIYFRLLRDYVRAMADKGNGLAVWLD
jgi:Domain of unknown function (DUF1877)